MILNAGADDAGRRLDRILRKALPDLPLSAIHRLLRQGKVIINGNTARKDHLVAAGARIEILLQEKTIEEKTPAEKTIPKQNNKAGEELLILYEGNGLLVLNKPAGLAVHGYPDSLDIRVQNYLTGRLPPSLSFKPGPLHRLDKPSSGIVVFGLSLEAAREFSVLLKTGKMHRSYLAIIEGRLEQEENWEDMLFRDTTTQTTIIQNIVQNSDGKQPTPGKMQYALTHAAPLAWAEHKGAVYTYVNLELGTGRTHQIRAQAGSRGFPLAGDRKYGSSERYSSKGFFGRGFFLHAAELKLPVEVPAMKDVPSVIKAPLPEEFAVTLKELFGY